MSLTRNQELSATAVGYVIGYALALVWVGLAAYVVKWVWL